MCGPDKVLGWVFLPLAGTHNIYNALAAVAVGVELDIPFSTIAGALKSYSGVQRRLQVKGEEQRITVVDDYGHHPTEIRATLSAMRMAWPKQRLVVMFQPHRYSRTRGLFKEFCTAFHLADLLFVTEIYPAGEQAIEGISGITLCDNIQAHGHKHVYPVPELDAIADQVLPYLKKDDVVLSLGAGNIWRAGEQLLESLRRE